MDCIFCKIINGQIPSHKVYEDEKFVAVLDANPIINGHILIIPKKHIERFKDFLPDDMMLFIVMFKKLIEKFERNISTDYNILVNQGTDAGQVVNHLHIHIIPRHDGDGIDMGNERGKLNESVAKDIIQRLK